MRPRSSASPTGWAASRPGKDANLFIAKGDPLEIRTVITHVIIDGRDVGLDSKHEALYREVPRAAITVRHLGELR